jgi:hypothetical protein
MAREHHSRRQQASVCSGLGRFHAAQVSDCSADRTSAWHKRPSARSKACLHVASEAGADYSVDVHTVSRWIAVETPVSSRALVGCLFNSDETHASNSYMHLGADADSGVDSRQ